MLQRCSTQHQQPVSTASGKPQSMGLLAELTATMLGPERKLSSCNVAPKQHLQGPAEAGHHGQMTSLPEQSSFTQLEPADPEALQGQLTCLPVHSGSGLRMAGIGMRPFQSSSHITMFIITSLPMKVSLLVIRRHPNNVSCTIPMTGLLAYSRTQTWV